MFEKFSLSDIDSSGGGGEYTVQAGFGWTNGVVLWVSSTYGEVLVAPNCPSILADFESAEGSATATSSVATSTSAAAVGLRPSVGKGFAALVVCAGMAAVGMLF